MPIQKARYWVAVLWLENLTKGWEGKLADQVQVPFAYCVHNLDTDSKSEHRKDHVHLMLCFSNTTTYKHALEVFKLVGEKAVNSCQAVVNVRHMYDYLIHDTESCRKAGKHLYPREARIEGNNFDIAVYENLSVAEKQDMLRELIGYTMAEGFTTIADMTVGMERDFEDPRYFEILIGYNAILDRYCKANFLKLRKLKEEAENQ